MLRRKVVFSLGILEHSFKAAQPHLPRRLIDFKRQVPGAHAWWSERLHVKRRSTEDRYKEHGRFPRGLFHVGRKETPDFRLLEHLIEVAHHAKDVLFPHDAVDLGI